MVVFFLMSSLAFFLMVFHISAYSISCLLSQFPAISRRFVIKTRVVDDIFDFFGLLIALAIFEALCWIMSVIVSLMVSMASSSCSVTNQFLNSSWNSIFFDPIRAASTIGHHFVSTSTSSLTLLMTSLWTLAMLTWLMTATLVTTSGLCIKMYSILVFFIPFAVFHVHILPAFFWNMVFMMFYFLDVAHSTKVSPFSLLNPSPKWPVAVSIGFVLFPS